MSAEKTPFIRFGDFLFKHRNKLFPLVLLLILLIAPPPNTEFGSHALEEIKDIIAIAIVGLGLALRGFVIGFAYIKRGGMNKQVYADTLVTDGIFNLSRNPLYVGNLLIYFGVFLMHGSPLIMTIGAPLFLVFYLAIVAAEEFFLRKKFGEAYESYCREVPRWLPHLKGLRTRFRKGTKDMDFNFKRVILKDYSTITNAAISLILIEYYEDLFMLPKEWLHFTLITLAALSIIGATALAIRTYKKRSIKT